MSLAFAGSAGSVATAAPVVPDCPLEALDTLVTSTPVIAVVDVLDVRSLDPAAQAGTDPAVRQYVKFRVERFMKGSMKDKALLAGFQVLKGAPYVDADHPRLSNVMFHRGNKFLLFLDKEAPRGGSPNPKDAALRTYFPTDCQCIPADGKTLRHVGRRVTELSGKG